MRTRQFIASLAALIVAPWKVLATKSKWGMTRIVCGGEVFPKMSDDVCGLIAVDRNESGTAAYLVRRPANQWFEYKGHRFNNYRGNKYWGVGLSGGDEVLLILEERYPYDENPEWNVRFFEPISRV